MMIIMFFMNCTKWDSSIFKTKKKKISMIFVYSYEWAVAFYRMNMFIAKISFFNF